MKDEKEAEERPARRGIARSSLHAGVRSAATASHLPFSSFRLHPYSSFFKLPQAHAEGGELLLDLVQARLAEVLAAEELVFGAGGELADRVDVKPLERLAAADGELEVGDVLRQRFRRRVTGGRGQ